MFYPPPFISRKMLFACVLLFISVVLSSNKAFSQLVGGSSANFSNQQLRAMFASISPPTPQPRIFYDLSVHFIDKAWWQPLQTDTSNTTLFAIQYDEMYTSHYDTTQFLRADTVFARAHTWGSDTAVIGLVDYLYCTLKDSALYDTTYFHIDTTGPTLYDNPNALGSPYLIDTVFNVCVFQDVSSSGSLTFRIDPDFLFFSPELVINADEFDRELQINFDDGTGWHVFPTNTLNFHAVNYPTEGIHTIAARIVQTQSSTIEALAMSKMVSPAADLTLEQPDTTWNHIDGLEIGVYWPCQYAFGSQDPKFIMVLEGFDFFESQGSKTIYSKFIKHSGLEYLRNYGYAFLIVNWKNSKISMIDNAMSVVDLVDYLKCTYLSQIGDDPQHQFVMAGASMGGVIARYALTYMEANPNFSSCMQALHHNTRLYISMDSPHQGGYVPLAFQELYDDVTSLAGFPANILLEQSQMGDIKNSMAATQLLNVHSNTNSGSSTTYSPHPNRIAFLDSLESLNPSTGGYPEHVKMMAISNGLLTGERQLGLNDECVMTPGDHYVLADMNLYEQILGIPKEGVNWHIELRSMRNGQPFYTIDFSEKKWGVQLKWKTIQLCAWPLGWPCINFAIPWGVEIGMVNHNTTSVTHTASGLPPYDVVPGGRMSFDGALGSSMFHFGTLWSLTIPWFSPPQNPTNCPSETVHSQRLNAVFTGYDLTVETQGLNFCFIPLQSALDYEGPVGQAHDIYNEDINTKLSRTPFDVIVGEVNGLGGYPQDTSSSTMPMNKFHFPSRNLDHVTLRNHLLPDSTLENYTLIGNPTIVDQGSLSQNLNYLAFYLNREIGDEQMFLDNLKLDRWALFEAEYDITAGQRSNPHYEYPGQPVGQQFVFKNYSSGGFSPAPNPYNYNLANNGIFAKSKPFEIEQQALANLKAQNSINTTGTVINGNLQINFAPQWVCDSMFNKWSYESIQIDTSALILNFLPYPNPVQRGQSLNINTSHTGKHEFSLHTIEGGEVRHMSHYLTSSEVIEMDITKDLSAGIYLLFISYADLRKTYKIVVQ